MAWPLCFSHNLALGKEDSNVAVCTLWTEKEQLLSQIPKDYYAVLGNLYSKKGIEYLVRNTLANPNLRYLVVFGQDMANSGAVLMDFASGAGIEAGIEKKHLDAFRQQVKVIDLRKGSVEELVKILEGLSQKRMEAFGPPIVLEESSSKVDSLPSENVNFVIREQQIADAWPKMLDLIMKYGEIKQTQYDMREKEVLNTVVTITEENQELKTFLKISKKELEDYLPTVLTAHKPVGINYTYGERLFSYKVDEYTEINQIKRIICQLKECPYTRRAVAMLWNVEKDRNSQHPPCLIYHSFLARSGRLYLTAVIRSNDIFKAWPLNAFALNELLKYVCRESGLKYGNLTILSNSAHVYETDWKDVEKIVSENLDNSRELVLDPRGYFVIFLKDSRIQVNHFTNEDRKTKYSFSGTSAEEIYKQIIKENLVSRFDHAAYIGKELARAEQHLKSSPNAEFRQDSM
jgi:thymidylate synthase